MENYFNYFTEIEEHFQRRRGTLTLLSPLDWALMEIWKDAGIPLEAVLRGIDAAFDKWERRPKRTRKVNGLAYCAQEVLAAAEEMKEAAVGGKPPEKESAGLEAATVIAVSACTTRMNWSAPRCRDRFRPLPAKRGWLALGGGFVRSRLPPPMEDVERRLTVMEEKLIAALLAAHSRGCAAAGSDRSRPRPGAVPQPDEGAADRAAP